MAEGKEMRKLLSVIFNEILAAHEDVPAEKLLKITEQCIHLIESELSEKTIEVECQVKHLNLEEIPVTDLNLEELSNSGQLYNRIYNCLKAENIKTIGELLKWRKSDLLKIPNFGKGSVDLIREALKRMGLSIGKNYIPGSCPWDNK